MGRSGEGDELADGKAGAGRKSGKLGRRPVRCQIEGTMVMRPQDNGTTGPKDNRTTGPKDNREKDEEAWVMRDYKKIEAWRKVNDLVIAVYELTRKFPKEELYGLTAQLCRAAYSVPANIAEGSARASKRDYLHFLCLRLTNRSPIFCPLGISAQLPFRNRLSSTGRTNQGCFRLPLRSYLLSRTKNKKVKQLTTPQTIHSPSPCDQWSCGPLSLDPLSRGPWSLLW
ncbi:MAG: four helix bundle protein [Candidatus Fervidibacter sp.]|uniref:four helix bundle protein n=1 Tax=Candidatus Fervidibacter sp. TaxID=3100871 RepID=UPI0040493691